MLLLSHHTPRLREASNSDDCEQRMPRVRIDTVQEEWP